MWLSRATTDDGKVTFGVASDRERSRQQAYEGGLEYEKLDPKTFMNEMEGAQLIVGANSFTRDIVPFFMLQRYDIHWVLRKSSDQAHVVEGIAFSRTGDNNVIRVQAKGVDNKEAIQKAAAALLVESKPWDEESKTNLDLFNKGKVANPRHLSHTQNQPSRRVRP